MRLLITPNPTREKTEKTLTACTGILESIGADYSITELTEDGGCPDTAGFDVMVFIGGDGTFLRSSKIALKSGLPVVGVAAGSVGYTADIKKDLAGSLSALCEGRYHTVKRSTISCMSDNGKKVAVNDVVLMAEKTVCGFDVTCSGRTILSTRASGLIAATAIGSSGFARSAGGSLVDDSIDVFALVPVCPYDGNMSPVIISPDHEYQIVFDRDISVSVDGSDRVFLQGGGKLSFCSCKEKLSIIKSEYFE